MDFSVVARSGLTQSEFASLAGVSRTTANTWIRGKMSPHRYINAQVTTLLKLLEEMVNAGDLPLRSRRGSARRAEVLAELFS